ncbi:MAG: LysM peptidoglycan-binding domain-containing protein [Candidatus Marinimicrobia bacterium]|nr:LysM peptidoglycan-binding domain-containing protein [Candidatus Neomarinimicrobiota bacterium]
MSNPIIRGILLTLFICTVFPQDEITDDSPDFAVPKLQSIVHHIEEGDSLESIMALYDVTLNELIQLNNFSYLLNITPGNKIIIRSPETISYITNPELPAPAFIYATHEKDSLHVRWQGHNNVYTRMYFSKDKQEWNPYEVSRNEQGIFNVAYKDLIPNPLYIKLVSVDTTDSFVESISSDIYSVHYDEIDNSKILIVDGFDRTSGSWKKASHDFATSYGTALFKQGIGFETCSNEALIQGLVELTNYKAVFWLAGDESTADESFSSMEQEAVWAYLLKGGNIFISGSEVAYDLGRKGSTADRTFLAEILGAEYVRDNARQQSAKGISGAFMDGIQIDFDDGSHGRYQEDSPDVLQVAAGIAVLNYGETDQVAAVANEVSIDDTTSRVFFMAFPLETVYSEDNQYLLVKRVLEYFAVSPSVKIEREDILEYDLMEAKKLTLPYLIIESPLEEVKIDTSLATPELIAVFWKEDSLIVSWDTTDLQMNLGLRLQYSGDNIKWRDLKQFLFLGGRAAIPYSLLIEKLIFIRAALVDTTRLENESLVSDVYGAFQVGAATGQAIIVDGFDRTTGSWKKASHDFATSYGNALFKQGIDFETCSNEAIIQGLVELTNYNAVFWMAGDESSADESVAKLEQEYINSYLSSGGNLFISGSEIAYDLDFKGDEQDKEFIHYTLHAEYVLDNADTNRAFGLSNSIFENLVISIDDGTHGTYQEDYPDVIRSVFDGKDGIEYQNGIGMAAIFYVGYVGRGKSQYEGNLLSTDRKGRTVFLSFPFETVYQETDRDSIMGRLLNYFEMYPRVIKEKVVIIAPIGEIEGPDITVKPPPKRKLNPNSFPTYVFLIKNNSWVEQTVGFEPILPEGWEIISFKHPLVIAPQAKEKVRTSFFVPPSARADTTFRIGLITKWGFQADTSFSGMEIYSKPAVRLISFTDEKKVTRGNVESQSFVIQNNGNIEDTLLLEVELPTAWKLIQLADSIGLSPKEKAIIEMLFKVPETAVPETKAEITLKVNSSAAMREGKDITRKHSTAIHILRPPKPKEVIFTYPRIPINVGFAIKNIEEGKYPEIQLFANTQSVDLGDYSTQLELTQTLQSTPLDQSPETNTERFKLDFAYNNWYFLFGDVLLESNPLMNSTSELALVDFNTTGELGRGIRVGYKFDIVDLSIFRGKKFNTENYITSALAHYQASEQLDLSSFYIGKMESHLMTMEGVYDTKKNRSFGALAGISQLNDGDKSIGSTLQLRAISTIYTMPLLGRIYSGSKSYTGTDRGRYGTVISSSWKPKPYLYLWGNYHVYNQSLSTAISDSSVFVNSIKTRSLLHYKNLPSLNLGFDFRSDLYSSGLEGKSSSIDLQIQKQLKYGMPTLYLKLDDKFNPINDEQQKINELRAEWISYFEHSRIKLDQRFIRNDSNPIGYISSIDMNFTIRKLPLGFFISRGKVWSGSKDLGYVSNKISTMGIRSNFGISPFGQNINVNLNISKQSYEDTGLFSDWSILVSFSLGKASRFYIPVTFIKTKGQIHGEVFIDKNGNNIRDIDEHGVPQIMLFLENENVISDGDGKFEFPPLDPGEYPFSVDLATLPAYLSLSKEMPEFISIRKGSVIFLQIPATSVSSINGYIYYDSNTNSKFDSNEKGISTIRLIIQDQKGKEWEAFTNKVGYYEVPDLLPDIYSIKIDSKWLPKRRLPGEKEWIIMLTQDTPQKSINLHLVKKKLEIKKTFTAPKKK